MLAADINTEIIREPGFASWVVYLVVFLLIVDRLKGWFVKDTPRREISGSVEQTTSKEPAIKAEVEKRMEAVEEELDSTQEQMLTETQALRTDGQNRVVALSELIRSELATRDQHIASMKDEILRRLDGFTQLVSAHDAILPRVEKSLAEHMRQYNEQVSKLHQRIDDAMCATSKRP
jgi:hypothetical protein